MTIKKKIEKVIEKGGHVSADVEKSFEWTTFCLRLKKSMSKDIDDILDMKVGLTKTGFILQAIDEKIRRERDDHRKMD